MEVHGPGKTWSIFVDESRQTIDRFMVIGGVITPHENIARFDSSMSLYRDANRMHATLKWVKVSDGKSEEYHRFVDLFFSVSHAIHFRCMVLDTSLIDYKTYSGGDRELGFYKFMYQFLLHTLRRYLAPDDKALVRLHRRTSSYKLEDLRSVLNTGLLRRRRDLTGRPVVSLEPRQCKGSELLQVADVLLGAVGYQTNNYQTRTNSKRAKVLLAEHIAQKAGLVSLSQQTPFAKSDFAIWHFRLRKKERPES